MAEQLATRRQDNRNVQAVQLLQLRVRVNVDFLDLGVGHGCQDCPLRIVAEPASGPGVQNDPRHADDQYDSGNRAAAEHIGWMAWERLSTGEPGMYDVS